MGDFTIKVMAAKELPEWTQTPEHEWFRKAYGYAATQYFTIPVLSKCSVEEIYSVMFAVRRSMEREAKKTKV